MLYRSAAKVAGANAAGAMLTGMGKDGAAAMLEMHQAGGITSRRRGELRGVRDAARGYQPGCGG